MYYRAVVEDNKDPLETSRVRVRIFGLHTVNNENSSEKFNNIKSDELPWAEVVGGTDFGLSAGVGLSSVLPQGTWVWVFLEQDNPNKPVVFGTVKGNVIERPSYENGEGFNDKDGINPISARTNESDFNRLGRNTKLQSPHYDTPRGVYNSVDTAHKQINDNLDIKTGISDGISGANVSQSEPSSTNDKTTYPNASVLETPSGHIVEFDDTPDNERVRVYHRSGSYIEIKPDGSFIQKSVGDTSHYIHVGDVETHIAKGVKSYIENNIDEIVDGGIRRNIKLDVAEHINGFFKITVDGNLEIANDVKITGSLETTGKISAGGDITSDGEVADTDGNLSSLRGEYDKHYHIGNLGVPTAITFQPDILTRASDFSWTSNSLGFK